MSNMGFWQRRCARSGEPTQRSPSRRWTVVPSQLVRSARACTEMRGAAHSCARLQAEFAKKGVHQSRRTRTHRLDLNRVTNRDAATGAPYRADCFLWSGLPRLVDQKPAELLA